MSCIARVSRVVLPVRRATERWMDCRLEHRNGRKYWERVIFRAFPSSSPDLSIPVSIAHDIQAILDLPRVEGGSRGRFAGLRRQQPWSESVDGEEFVESLLLVVLRARVRKNPSQHHALQ